jgi:hypothetical protein
MALLSALDRVIAAKIASRLQEIGQALSGLWDASNAAKEYIRHARF